MAVITDAKVWGGQQIGSGGWFVPELAHMGAAEVAGNEALNDHLPCPLASLSGS